MLRKIAPAALLFLIAASAPSTPPTAPTPPTVPPARIAAAKFPNLPAGAKLLKDVPYVKHATAHQKLDIVTLAGAKPVPLIVWIHGGGWIEGNKSVARAAPFINDGYAVAAINYRLSTDAIFPAQIEDCKAAIRFLRAHAREYNIDPGKIGVWGESAGGHLAALPGTSGDVKALEGKNPEYRNVSDAVQCVVDYFGPTDLAQLPAMAGAGAKYDPHSGPGLLLTMLLGGTLADKPGLAAAANPMTYITKSGPPFLIVHGSADPVVPVAQSKILYEALLKAGDKADFIEVKSAQHGPGIYGNPAVWTKVKAIFASTLKSSGNESPKPPSAK